MEIKGLLSGDVLECCKEFEVPHALKYGDWITIKNGTLWQLAAGNELTSGNKVEGVNLSLAVVLESIDTGEFLPTRNSFEYVKTKQWIAVRKKTLQTHFKRRGGEAF